MFPKPPMETLFKDPSFMIVSDSGIVKLSKDPAQLFIMMIFLFEIISTRYFVPGKFVGMTGFFVFSQLLFSSF